MTTHDASLGQRTGYDPAFVGERIEVPAGIEAGDAVLLNGSPVIHYTRFLLWSSARADDSCRWVALEHRQGSTLPDPDGPNTIGRDGSSEFTIDQSHRPESAESETRFIKNNRLDRGHVARRADLLWGER